MNKDEILQKSRSENMDEGNLYILNKGSKYGSLLFIRIVLPLIFFTIFTWRLSELALLLTVLWGFLTGHYMGWNKALRHDKKGLIVVSWIFTIVCFITYLNEVYAWY